MARVRNDSGEDLTTEHGAVKADGILEIPDEALPSYVGTDKEPGNGLWSEVATAKKPTKEQ